MDDEAKMVHIEDLSIPDTLPLLSRGSHKAGSGTPCAMEAASWLADERWSAQPRTVHPVIARVARIVNDSISDEERQLLWPLILSSLGTGRQHSPLLYLRLKRFAERRLEHEHGGPSRLTWEAVLQRFAELAKKDTAVLSEERWNDLDTRLHRRFADGASR